MNQRILRRKSGAAVELAKQETDPFWHTYVLALAQFADGNPAEADAALKKLIDEDADDDDASSQIAQVYAMRKEPEKMFEWLEHAWTDALVPRETALSVISLTGFASITSFVPCARAARSAKILGTSDYVKMRRNILQKSETFTRFCPANNVYTATDALQKRLPAEVTLFSNTGIGI